MKLYNFRDLGGLPTSCNRKIKSGLLYRTGNVAHWSDDAAKHVVQDCGVKLYIDFRNADEVKKFGRPEALIRQNVKWLPLSINTSDVIFEKVKLPKANDWLELYQRLFENNISAWAEFAKVVAFTRDPILYGCLFGKDRTGIATSILLNILDVHDEHIAADYAKTTDHVRPLALMFEHLLDHPAHKKDNPTEKSLSEEELFEHFSRSHSDVMFGFLEYLRTHPENHFLAKQLKQLTETYQAPLKSRLLD
ncbi:MAG: tyrosine-protein phosphatase [Bdellovibrionales bacterium]